MTRALPRGLVLGALAALGTVGALGGCPGPDGNPATLWLAPDMAETRVKLIDHEPPPF